jgi:hypothetical protein
MHALFILVLCTCRQVAGVSMTAGYLCSCQTMPALLHLLVVCCLQTTSCSVTQLTGLTSRQQVRCRDAAPAATADYITMCSVGR